MTQLWTHIGEMTEPYSAKMLTLLHLTKSNNFLSTMLQKLDTLSIRKLIVEAPLSNMWFGLSIERDSMLEDVL